MHKLRTLPWLIGLGLLIAGNGCQSSPKGPAIELGVTQCHRCNQAVTDLGWAASDETGGTARIYDDPGCLFATRRETPGSSEPLFQDKAGSGLWLAAADTWFATVNGVRSPAGHGWGAYASFADAQEAVTAGGGGRILRYEQAGEVIGLPAQPGKTAAR